MQKVYFNLCMPKRVAEALGGGGGRYSILYRFLLIEYHVGRIDVEK